MGKRILIALSLTVSVLVIAVGLAYALRLGPWRPSTPSSEDPGPVIATVDGEPIHLAEARARVESLSSVHGDVQQVLGKDWPQRVLQSLVDDRILVREAERLGIRVTQQDIQAHLDAVRSMLPEGQSLEDWLASQHMTLAELERRVELQLLGGRVYAEVTKDASVDPHELRAYYRDHRADLQEADGTIPPLLEVRRSLRQTLLQQARDAAYADWLERARERAHVVVLIEDWWQRL